MKQIRNIIVNTFGYIDDENVYVCFTKKTIKFDFLHFYSVKTRKIYKMFKFIFSSASSTVVDKSAFFFFFF